MPKYSSASLKILGELHPDLQTLMLAVIEKIDISLVCGYRGKVAQHKAFLAKASKVDWPLSKHNRKPALAVDWKPYPDRFKDLDYAFAAGFIQATADRLFAEGKIKHRVRSGADWSQNGQISDESFKDLGHTELVGVE